jgi:hypothetical protein
VYPASHLRFACHLCGIWISGAERRFPIWSRRFPARNTVVRCDDIVFRRGISFSDAVMQFSGAGTACSGAVTHFSGAVTGLTGAEYDSRALARRFPVQSRHFPERLRRSPAQCGRFGAQSGRSAGPSQGCRRRSDAGGAGRDRGALRRVYAGFECNLACAVAAPKKQRRATAAGQTSRKSRRAVPGNT